MKKLMIFFLLVTLTLFISSCDEWDELVDSVSGSGDDTEDTVAEDVADSSTSDTKDDTSKDDSTTESKDTSKDTSKDSSKDTSKSEDKDNDADKPTKYESKFHHTTTGSSDGGKSLVLCPRQSMNFSSCKTGKVKIPRHDSDKGRETYWNMKQEPVGDIICVKNGKSYKYKANKKVLYGKCD